MNCLVKTSLVALALGGAPLAAQDTTPADARPVEITNGGFEDEGARADG